MASSCFLSVLKESIQNIFDFGPFICSYTLESMQNVKEEWKHENQN